MTSKSTDKQIVDIICPLLADHICWQVIFENYNQMSSGRKLAFGFDLDLRKCELSPKVLVGVAAYFSSPSGATLCLDHIPSPGGQSPECWRGKWSVCCSLAGQQPMSHAAVNGRLHPSARSRKVYHSRQSHFLYQLHSHGCFAVQQGWLNNYAPDRRISKN
jgi:hypothetical protein